MIKEYALEPEAVCSPDKFRYLMGMFGVHEGRLIADLPREWKRAYWALMKQQGLGDSALNRIEVALERSTFKDKFSIRQGCRYEENKTWIANILQEDKRDPFDGIICLKEEKAGGNKCVPEETLDAEHPVWAVSRTRKVKRTAGEMAKAVRKLLINSREVVFIDPYFLKWDDRSRVYTVSPRHESTLVMFLRILATRGVQLGHMAFHCANQGPVKLQASSFSTIKTHLEGMLPAKFGLSLYLWQRDQMHNRFILTDRGGVMFGHGLDEDGHSPIRQDDISLMDRAHWKERWDEYRELKGNGVRPMEVVVRK